MKITKIKANNFKSLKDFEINFSKNVNSNIIFGVNGAGKSTIISILNVISRIFKLKIDEYNLLRTEFPFKPANVDDLVSLYNQYSTIGFKGEIELGINFIDNNNKEFYYNINLGPNGIVTFEEFGQIKNYNKHEIFSKNFNNAINITNIEDIFKSELYDLNKLEKNSIASLIYFIILRNYNTLKRDFSHDKYDFIIPLYDLFVDFSNHIRNTREQNAYEETRDALFNFGMVSLNSHHEDYDKWIKNIIKDIDNFSEFATTIDSSIIEVSILVEPIRGSVDNSISFSFEKRINGRIIKVPWNLESMGTKIYSQLYRAYRKLRKRNLNFIVTFDEFGSSLNEVLIVNIYKKLYESAKENNRQIILTTHSTILLNKEFLKQKENSNWNKERFIIDRNNADGITRALDLRNVDKKENNQRKYLIGKYGGTPILGDYFDE